MSDIHASARRLRRLAAFAATTLISIGTAAQGPARADASSRVTVGLGLAHLPNYEGSDRRTTRALPVFDFRSGRFFAGVLGGIGYDLAVWPRFEAGPVLAYRGGRDEADDARLAGLGDIDSGLEVGAFARWRLAPFTLHGRVMHGVGDAAKGTRIRFGIGHASALGDADALMLDASAEWADADLTQAFFGVDAAQSARSGLARFDAGAGIKSFGASAVWTHRFTPAWFSSVGVRLRRLTGDAADSPITVEATGSGVSAAVGYRF